MAGVDQRVLILQAPDRVRLELAVSGQSVLRFSSGAVLRDLSCFEAHQHSHYGRELELDLIQSQTTGATRLAAPADPAQCPSTPVRPSTPDVDRNARKLRRLQCELA